jgi:hypothetical protein
MTSTPKTTLLACSLLPSLLLLSACSSACSRLGIGREPDDGAVKKSVAPVALEAAKLTPAAPGSVVCRLLLVQ